MEANFAAPVGSVQNLRRSCGPRSDNGGSSAAAAAAAAAASWFSRGPL